jgi:hypothetical protein
MKVSTKFHETATLPSTVSMSKDWWAYGAVWKLSGREKSLVSAGIETRLLDHAHLKIVKVFPVTFFHNLNNLLQMTISAT